MSITLTSGSTTIELPSGLRWTDEFDWNPVAQSIETGLTGAPIIQQGTRQAGRPLTLEGGRQWAWITRSDLLALHQLLSVAGAQPTVTLHDGRQFLVVPDLSAGALDTESLRGEADPESSTRYVLTALRFLILEEL